MSLGTPNAETSTSAFLTWGGDLHVCEGRLTAIWVTVLFECRRLRDTQHKFLIDDPEDFPAIDQNNEGVVQQMNDSGKSSNTTSSGNSTPAQNNNFSPGSSQTLIPEAWEVEWHSGRTFVAWSACLDCHCYIRAICLLAVKMLPWVQYCAKIKFRVLATLSNSNAWQLAGALGAISTFGESERLL